MKRFLCTILAIILVIAMAPSVFAYTISVQGIIPTGKVGDFYTVNFTVSSFIHIKTWDFSGTIPGLTFSGHGGSGTLSGIPGQAGSFNCSLTVTDEDGNSSELLQFDVIIEPRDSDGDGDNQDVNTNTGGELSIGGYLYFQNDKVGTSYPKNDHGQLVAKATADGGTPPYTWSVSKGELPKGLCVACSPTGLGCRDNTNVGPYAVLSGVIALEGTYNFTLKVTDSTGKSATKDFSFEVTGGDLDELVIEGDAVGTRADWIWLDTYSFSKYSENFIHVKSGRGRSPFTWSQAGGALPEDITISNDGDKALISGTPSEGKYDFVIKVTDADGRTATKAYTVKYTMGSKIPPEYGSHETDVLIPEISGNFDSGTVGVSYSGTASVTGGITPYQWERANGEFPSGVSLANTTGSTVQITGKPENPGFYNFALKVTDAKGNTNAKTFCIKVDGDSSTGTGDNNDNSNDNDNTEEGSQNNNENEYNNDDDINKNDQKDNANENNENDGNNNGTSEDNDALDVDENKNETVSYVGGGGGGGGCDSGIGLLALVVVALIKRKQ